MSWTSERRVLGARAEDLVAQHLEARGFSIVARNARVGPREIDLIARRGDLVVVCEVRSRSNAGFGDPLETIGPAKIARVRSAAAAWIAGAGWRGVAIRFDAASVVFDVPGGRLDYVEDAF